jgi:hypothetical protein
LLSRRSALVFGLTVLACLGGCGQPSNEARQNRRLVDGLLTAVTTKNRKELEKCKRMLDKRRADGLLSKSNHKRLGEISDQARLGKWSEAEDALYQLRDSEPFPR